jgi:LacI family transcriptional regulator
MMAALQPALAEAGYALMVAAAGDVRAHELAQIRMLLQRGVDAIVLMGVPELGSLDTLPAARGVPRVHLGGGGSGLHWIGVDLVLAAATVAGFLRSLGHRQVATLGAARPKGMATAYLPALQRALAEAAIDATGEVAADGHDDFAAARVAIRELLQRGSSATAIVCDSDILAAGVVRECCEMGISVPDQVSVVGFGDLEIARRSQPTLTTIRIPFDEIGRHVVACLRAQIDAGTVHGRQLPGKLVARGSTAVAPT